MQPTFQQQIINRSDLSRPPAVAIALIEQVAADPSDTSELAAIIGRDILLRARLLRVLNSNLYGLPPITAIEQACEVLGTRSVAMLAMGFSLIEVFRHQKAGGFKYLHYWRRSMYAATAARVIADQVLINQKEPCFIAALLMDIGTLVLDLVLGERYSETWERVISHTDLPVVETHLFRTNHAEIGASVLAHWGVPPSLTVPIGAHHNPCDVDDASHRPIAQVLWLAGRCADIFVAPLQAAEGIMEVRKYFMQQYHLSELQCDGMLCTIGRNSAELAHLFDIRLNTPVNFEHVVENASSRLTELSLAQSKEFALNRRKTQRKVHTGPISIIPCRRGILEPRQQVTLHDVSSSGIGFTRETPMAKGQQFVIQLPDTTTGMVKTLLYTVVRCDIRAGVASIGAELTSVLRPESVLKARAA